MSLDHQPCHLSPALYGHGPGTATRLLASLGKAPLLTLCPVCGPSGHFLTPLTFIRPAAPPLGPLTSCLIALPVSPLSILSSLHQCGIHHSQPFPVASHPHLYTGSSVPTGEKPCSLPTSQLPLALCRAGDLGQIVHLHKDTFMSSMLPFPAEATSYPACEASRWNGRTQAGESDRHQFQLPSPYFLTRGMLTDSLT